jgi:voltage-gated potassium channel
MAMAEKLFKKFEEPEDTRPDEGWRERLYEIIFESNTKSGKLFDIVLVILILSSISVIMLESIESVYIKYKFLFIGLHLLYTFVFTIEYILRLICVKRPLKYALSFYGIIDLLAIVPSFLEIIFPQTHFLMLIRSFRLLRIFRIFKMVGFLKESRLLVFSLLSSYRKVIVFLLFVLLLTVFLGSFMYVLEYKHNPSFSSIPQSIYWAIVTITTVGYGDIAPQTVLGKMLASFIMILGYAIIAVPTGIVSASFLKEWNNEKQSPHKRCENCLLEGHEYDAIYCRKCGQKFNDDDVEPVS